MASKANQGKKYEKEVNDYLKAAKAKYIEFDYLRLPDARTAMGRGTSMPADFEFFAPLRHGLIEVKSVNHEFRLPHANLTQLPKMKMRERAGGICIILVYFRKSEKWCRASAGALETKTSGSYDFRGFEMHDTLEQALPEHLLVGRDK